MALALFAAAPQHPTGAQDDLDLPLLPDAISDTNIELRGRYARQWKQPDGTFVVMYTGAFGLKMGRRELTANNGVVWIAQRSDPESEQKHFELTVYLSEEAEVIEPGGTITEDQVLLIRNLRTRGRITKLSDAVAPENGENLALYQQAQRDRVAIESGVAPDRMIASPTSAPSTPEPATTAKPVRRKPPRVVRLNVPQLIPTELPSGETVYIARDGVYLSQDGGPGAPPVEIRADHAVIFPGERGSAGLIGQAISGGDERPSSTAPATGPPKTPDAAAPATGTGAFGLDAGGISDQIRSVYLEGDVVLTSGNRFVRAARLFYDFEESRALILDAVFRLELPERNIPFYIRADEIRQLSATDFSARNAKVTSSEFATPSYHVGADKVVLTDTTRRDSTGRNASQISGNYEMTNSSINLYGIPFTYWPYSKGTLEGSETALQSFSTGYNSDFGYSVETRWDPFTLTGLPRPIGWTADLRLDYFSKRGPGIGLDADYDTVKNFGLFRSYYINDHGEDDLGPLRQAGEVPPSDNRGRVLWRHRQFLENDWVAQIELSYISDANFLEEYYKSEFQEGKEQETLVYLKRVRDVESIEFIAKVRILDWLTQTQELPQITYRRIGDLLDPFVLYHESRIGMVQYLPDERIYFQESEVTNTGRTKLLLRADGRQEAELPLKFANINVVPFSSVRGTYWDNEPMPQSTTWRGLGVYGVRGGSQLWRTFDDIENDLFDVHRIRHIVAPEFAAWWASSDTRSEYLTPFTYDIETIDPFYGFYAAINQTWQTKRGAGERQRTVDLVTWNVSTGIFGNTEGRQDWSDGWVNPWRPEDSRTRNFLASDLAWRISDSTTLLYAFNYDYASGQFDQQNVSLAVERSPRLSYVVGARYAGDISLSLVGGGFNYQLTQKHTVATRLYWDVGNGQLGEIAFAYVRRLPRWFYSLNLVYDNVDDEWQISVSLWPEGVPEWTLGSRRFTGLGTSTGINP